MGDFLSFGSPKGSRTPHSAVKGRCLNRLTMGPCAKFWLRYHLHECAHFFYAKFGTYYEGQPIVFPSLLLFLFLKGLGLKFYTSACNVGWWRWVELNYRSTGYEPVALTSEPHRRVTGKEYQI